MSRPKRNKLNQICLKTRLCIKKVWCIGGFPAFANPLGSAATARTKKRFKFQHINSGCNFKTKIKGHTNSCLLCFQKIKLFSFANLSMAWQYRWNRRKRRCLGGRLRWFPPSRSVFELFGG
jgi:hypothetical protein